MLLRCKRTHVLRNNRPHPLAHRHPHSIPNPRWQRRPFGPHPSIPWVHSIPTPRWQRPLDPFAHYPLPTILCSAPLRTSIHPLVHSIPNPRWQRRPLDPFARSPLPTVFCSAPHTLRSFGGLRPPHSLRSPPPQHQRLRMGRQIALRRVRPVLHALLGRGGLQPLDVHRCQEDVRVARAPGEHVKVTNG
jgi:hypothetical protein